MMKHEFEELIQSPVSESDYKVIENVYMYHPATPDKNSIAKLYLTFGMVVIRDMSPRAKKIEELEKVKCS